MGSGLLQCRQVSQIMLTHEGCLRRKIIVCRNVVSTYHIFVFGLDSNTACDTIIIFDMLYKSIDYSSLPSLFSLLFHIIFARGRNEERGMRRMIKSWCTRVGVGGGGPSCSIVRGDQQTLNATRG
jgi:hypothetical protein